MNYYNYFTEVEDHFRQVRDSGMFYLSSLDWVLLETWRDNGVPLEAVLTGIDAAFEKYHSRARRVTTVNSLAYCTQEVLKAAREQGGDALAGRTEQRPGMENSTLSGFFRERAGELRRLETAGGAGCEVFGQSAATLESLAESADRKKLGNLEDVERRLGVIEDRILGVAAATLTEDQLLAARRDFDAQLAPYRRKLSRQDVAMLEQRFLRQRSLEEMGLSRLSLFHVA